MSISSSWLGMVAGYRGALSRLIAALIFSWRTLAVTILVELVTGYDVVQANAPPATRCIAAGDTIHDDLKAITLSDETVRAAIEVWPMIERRTGLPDDLEKVLEQLQVGRGS